MYKGLVILCLGDGGESLRPLHLDSDANCLKLLQLKAVVLGANRKLKLIGEITKDNPPTF